MKRNRQEEGESQKKKSKTVSEMNKCKGGRAKKETR